MNQSSLYHLHTYLLYLDQFEALSSIVALEVSFLFSDGNRSWSEQPESYVGGVRKKELHNFTSIYIYRLRLILRVHLSEDGLDGSEATYAQTHKQHQGNKTIETIIIGRVQLETEEGRRLYLCLFSSSSKNFCASSFTVCWGTWAWRSYSMLKSL